jgi:hypothetical protein
MDLITMLPSPQISGCRIRRGQVTATAAANQGQVCHGDRTTRQTYGTSKFDAALVTSDSSSTTTSESVVVNLRIEGADCTIFEGPISTVGHNVTTPMTGTRRGTGFQHSESRISFAQCSTLSVFQPTANPTEKTRHIILLPPVPLTMPHTSMDLLSMGMCVPILQFMSFSSPSVLYQYSAKWDDIFITRIADTTQDNERFWGILLNYQYVFSSCT